MRLIQSTLFGAIAGAVSAAAFALVHALLISNIWFSLPMMMPAGAICGACLAWTYDLVVENPTTGRWLRFNALFVGMFGMITLVSLVVFDPITTLAEMMTLNGPPSELIAQAMPITILSTLAMAGIISLLYARSWLQVGSVLLTCAILVVLLGLNVSVIGLVSIPRSALYLVAEMFGLILALNLVFVVVYLGLQWKPLRDRIEILINT